MIMLFKCFLFLYFNFFALNAEKILFVPAHLGESHAKSMLPFAEFLAEKGHQVSIWFPATADLTEKLPTKKVKLWQTEIPKNVPTSRENDDEIIKKLWDRKGLLTVHVLSPWYFALQPCNAAIRHNFSDVQKLLDENWDIFMTDTLFASCAYVFGYLSPNSSRIPMATSYLNWLTARSRGTPTATAPYAEWIQFQFDHRMFWDRFFEATKLYISISVMKFFSTFLALVYFPDILPPSFDILDFDGQGLFMTYEISTLLDLPRPYTTDTIGIGDLRCKSSSKSLPLEYQQFVEVPASKGTVIAAFGHTTRWKSAPKAILEAYWGAFEKLSDYRIIWQYDGPLLKNLTNVKIVHWLPQTELLSHPKTKAFISHCGLKSLSEAICAKVPVVGFPIFAEQMRNAQLVVHHGIGTKMNKFAMTPEYAYDMLIDVLETNQEAHKRKVTKLADMIQDRPISGLEQGVFGVERALKKRGVGLYRKVKGADLGDLTYFSVDMIFAGFFVIILMEISIA